MKKILRKSALLLLVTLTGCGLGAVASGYSLKTQTADHLSETAEQKIIDKVKAETIAELEAQHKLIKK